MIDETVDSIVENYSYTGYSLLLNISSAGWTNVYCNDIYESVLTDVNVGDHVVVAGYKTPDATFSFSDCEILSCTSGKTYGGRLRSDGSLAEALEVADLLVPLQPAPDPAPESTPAPDPAPESTPAPDQESPSDLTVFEMDHFSVTIPNSWKGKVTVTQGDDYISFYEIQNNLAGYGGYLFGVECMDKAAYQELFTNNETLGVLTTQDWDTYYLVALYPSDVPYNYEDSVLLDAYTSLRADIDGILETVEPLNGCTFTPQYDGSSEAYEIPEHRQVLFLDIYDNDSTGELYLEEWSDGVWTCSFDTLAYIGSNGITYLKQEGDHCTPAGSFSILYYLSTKKQTTGLCPVIVSEGDVWVDDSDSAYYNTLQSSSSRSKDWSSSENIYKQLSSGSVYIYFDFNGDGWNRGSAIPGQGSCLFLCGVPSGGDLQSGYGDIKITDSDMRKLLSLLDSEEDPIIVIENDPEWTDGIRYFDTPVNEASIPW